MARDVPLKLKQCNETLYVISPLNGVRKPVCFAEMYMQVCLLNTLAWRVTIVTDVLHCLELWDLIHTKVQVGPLYARYVGTWFEDKKDGMGAQFWGDGNSYVGGFSAGEFSGHGAKIENGITYVGDIVDGMELGQGAKVWPDGRKYAGDLFDGVMMGQGAMTYPDGGKYAGDWEGGLRHGQGSMMYANGAVYVGFWKDDQLNGYGKMTLPDGTEYEGQWANGLRHGVGLARLANGDVHVGKWQYDVFVASL
jgi:hypothetical protein